ncbi:hypothetical protein WMK_00169 [Enterococcus faecalis ATCC 35038]|uniref:hypothetical protein n=2 Tax=Enterococcus TaxID=1350 RepID=UPI0001E197A8|nr:hypothetical protein [Enterococcus faecalis]EFU09848.1 hypothetical protein HMPREF9516_00530 [Enterococcus faecalis TX1302]MDU8952345.1 hypothetical protein [Streptococcus sp.]EFM71126.1 hypothetical protein HMPREF9505_00571 [Enterococcus faecalis TX0109]EGO2579805.1 hypothetical protein [Enterococcus faecalis]EGO2598281.1 hypothetical protein [Enterococcus faecalis]
MEFFYERYPTFKNLEKLSQILNANAIQLFGTMKEIAVSDTPKILDKIDEYDNKIQNILKVEQFLNNVSLEEIDKTFHKLRYIKETLSPQILTSNDSEPIFDSSDEPIFEPDGQVMYGPSAFDK